MVMKTIAINGFSMVLPPMNHQQNQHHPDHLWDRLHAHPHPLGIVRLVLTSSRQKLFSQHRCQVRGRRPGFRNFISTNQNILCTGVKPIPIMTKPIFYQRVCLHLFDVSRPACSLDRFVLNISQLESKSPLLHYHTIKLSSFFCN